ncbi:MAG: TIGR03960 family B12-binding radical SAM protein, partial [Candidatus Obscuribacterales bacterium]|nr:TIGR03960 family B12-binding radical SAM protein [Candidatus Obscuribacterales bacterium]
MINHQVASLAGSAATATRKLSLRPDEISRTLTDDLLLNVERPGQYLGNEWGAFRKPFDKCQVHLCLAFPDLYELGMSNFGLRILYELINKAPDLMCDRTYAPGRDMEALMRKRDFPLWAWESREALTNFELVGFSLQYELTYTNVLNMLQLAGIEIDACQRESVFPLIFGGGPSAVNPEPMARFMDFFIIGDGERAVIEVMNCIAEFKKSGQAGKDARKQLLRQLAKIDGVYVPSLYEETPESPYVMPKEEGLPLRVLRQVSQLTDANQPAGGLVPYLSLVHDRQVLEVRRGCDRGCRFCQPGYTFLPVRERSADDLLRISKEAIKNTGYEEYSMLSLCVSDYTSLHESVRSLNQFHSAQRTSMSFPSQRADRMNMEVAEELKSVRKSGITLAPEAGTERLRAVINKGLKHEQIISAIESAYRSGWSSVKLYYMIGLPTELDEDLDGIVNTLKEASELCRKIKREGDPSVFNRAIEFTCTISNFVPKPFTPFQWYGQPTPSEFTRKQNYLRDRL